MFFIVKSATINSRYLPMNGLIQSFCFLKWRENLRRSTRRISIYHRQKNNPAPVVIVMAAQPYSRFTIRF
jgi:hypothetical protein